MACKWCGKELSTADDLDICQECKAQHSYHEGWMCPICHVAYPPWVTKCECSKDTGYYTTTQNVHTRFAHKGPLPPPVVDFSTDQCPTCGEVLNQCKCPQVLQRVHFNDEQNQKLKELLYEVALCGVEHDDERLDYVTIQVDRRTWNELREMRGGGVTE